MIEKGLPISTENRMIAQGVAAAFGGTPRVSEYQNESESVAIGILYCSDRPRNGDTSYSTIKLSDYPIKWGAGEFPTRIELVGVCASIEDYFPNVLASASFSIIQSNVEY